MRKLVIGLLGASALALASAANAASCGVDCSYSTTPGNAIYSGPTPTYDWDSLATTPTTTNGAVVTGNNGLLWSQPLGSTGNFYEVGPNTTQPGFIDLSSISAIGSMSFIWGSADYYNTLEIIARDGVTVLGTILGTDVSDGSGNPSNPLTNPIVTLTFGPLDQANIGGLRLSSSQNSFEVDNFAITGVPEPATWALMLLGFGGIGFAMRRGRKPALAQLA